MTRPVAVTYPMPAPHLRVDAAQTRMFLWLPSEFRGGNSEARLWWVRDICGKGSRIPADDDGRFRPSRDQFWRVLGAVVFEFGRTRMSVTRPEGHPLPRALRDVGWHLVGEASSGGRMTTTWLVTSDTIRRTPSRSEFLWRHWA